MFSCRVCRQCGTVLLALTIGFETQGQEESQQSYRDELSHVTVQLNNKQSWLDEANVRLQTMVDDVKSLDQSIQSIASEKETILFQIEALADSIYVLDQDSKRYQKEIDQLLLERRWILHAFKQIDSTQLLLMLHHASDPSLLDRLEHYHRILLQEREVSLNQIEQKSAQLASNLAKMNDNSNTLKSQREKILQQEQTLVQQRFSQRRVADELFDAIKSEELQTQKLLADQERLESLLSHIEPVNLTTFPDFANSGTTSPVHGIIKHRFGDARGDGRLSWEGVYYTAEEGTIVSAVRSGRVEFANWLRGFGMTIILVHDKDLMTLYGNCDSLMVSQGDIVESGEAIAVVGRSGGRREIGLYFEVREQNEPIDPIRWFEDN